MDNCQFHLPLQPTCATDVLAFDQTGLGIQPKRICDENPSACFRSYKHRDALLDRIGGLYLPALPEAPPMASLPEVVVALRGDAKCPFAPSVLGEAVAIPVDQVIGRLKPKAGLGHWRQRLHIPEDMHVLLFQESADDVLMDVVLELFENDETLEAIKKLGKVTVIGLAPSIYTRGGSQCAQLQSLHLKLSTRCYARLALAGIPAVLNVGWASEQHLRLLADALRDAGDRIHTLAINVQTGAGTEFDNLREIGMLEKLVGKSYRWILIGSVKQAFLDAAEAVVPRSRRMHVSPQLREKTLAGRTLTGSVSAAAKDDLLAQNIDMVRQRMALAQERQRKSCRQRS